MSSNYDEMTVVQLREIASELGLTGFSKSKKADLIAMIEGNEHPVKQTNQKKATNPRFSKIKDNINEAKDVEGILNLRPEGYGLIDDALPDYSIYVSATQIQKFRLQTGYRIGGKVRPPKATEKYGAMLYLITVNGESTSKIIEKENNMLRGEIRDETARYKKSHVGILDLNHEDYGFLRTHNYQAGEHDIYVAPNIIRRFNLRTGDKIVGRIRMPNEGEKYDALLYVEKLNGDIPEKAANRPHFERLTPVFPDERISLETDRNTLSTRIIDLFSPMGLGQRGMLVAAPKAGKTTLLKNIAKGIVKNHPNIELIILLVDERPEEVTDMQRFIDCDIVHSTFDQPAENHICVAEMVLERGKRLVEQGKDAVILVDSLTRLTRANNLVISPSGRTLSGGLDPESLYFPKKFFGSARNIENGGSLTIMATALIETGSRMDDIIFEEFKGTGNMELHLERELAERRIYPAINISRSGTRREDLLLSKVEQKVAFSIRKLYGGVGAIQTTDKILSAFEKTESNEDFIKRFDASLNAQKA